MFETEGLVGIDRLNILSPKFCQQQPIHPFDNHVLQMVHAHFLQQKGNHMFLSKKERKHL